MAKATAPTPDWAVGDGFRTVLDPLIGSGYENATASSSTSAFLPGAATVGISGQWLLVCNASLCIYAMLLPVFFRTVWSAVGAAGDAWGSRVRQRRIMATLGAAQSFLGLVVILWILVGFFRLTRSRVVDGFVVVLGQRLSMHIISLMLLLKAYYVCGQSRVVLGLGGLLLLAGLALTGLKCATLPAPTMRWGYYAVELSAYLGTGIAIIMEMVLNLYLSVCFLVVVFRHTRSATSPLYLRLLYDGLAFALICTITNIVLAILFLTGTLHNGILSILYHVSWAIQSWLMVRQLTTARQFKSTTTTIRASTQISRYSYSTAAVGTRPNTMRGVSALYEKREVAGVLAPSLIGHSARPSMEVEKMGKHVPIGTYLPAGRHGSATPQHHAMLPGKPALRSPPPLTATVADLSRPQRRVVSFTVTRPQQAIAQRISYVSQHEADHSSGSMSSTLANRRHSGSGGDFSFEDSLNWSRRYDEQLDPANRTHESTESTRANASGQTDRTVSMLSPMLPGDRTQEASTSANTTVGEGLTHIQFDNSDTSIAVDADETVQSNSSHWASRIIDELMLNYMTPASPTQPR